MTKHNSEEQKEKLYEYVDKHFWSIYNRDTTTLSNTCRQLALAEGGICWVIISSNYPSLISFFQINTVLIMLVLFFIFDAAQYLFSSRAFKTLAKHYNDQISDNIITDQKELKIPQGINTVANVCFILKLSTLSLTSLFLIYLILMRHAC